MCATDTKKKTFSLKKGSSNKTMSYTKGPRKRLSRNGVYSFQMFWHMMNSPSLLTVAKRGKKWTQLSHEVFPLTKRGSTHWSKQSKDHVSKTLFSYSTGLFFSDERDKWVYNLRNRQKSLVLMKLPLFIFPKTDTIVIILKGRLSTRI